MHVHAMLLTGNVKNVNFNLQFTLNEFGASVKEELKSMQAEEGIVGELPNSWMTALTHSIAPSFPS